MNVYRRARGACALICTMAVLPVAAPAQPAAVAAGVASTSTFRNADGGLVFVHRWLPTGAVKAAVLIVHGLAEHGGRYERFAQALNAANYAVYAPDNRGHGRTAAPGQLGNGGPDAWNGTERDLAQLAGSIRKEQPRAPLFLFGHSLGSAFAQRFAELHGNELAGLVLSGTFGNVPGLAQTLEAVDAASKGSGALDKTIAPKLFAPYNAKFTNRTGFEWLSRDSAEVDTYVHDPLSGFAVNNRYVDDFLHGFAVTWEPANEALISTGLPILIFGGDADPVGAETVSVKALADRYDAHGIKDVRYTFYPGGRHEMLNETNREFVQRDVVSWLDEHVAQPR